VTGDRLVRALLLLYPEPLRHRYRAELLATLRERRRRALLKSGRRRALLTAAGDALDLLLCACRARLEEAPQSALPDPDVPDPRGGEPVHSLAVDLRIALRALRRRPSYSVVAVLTLGMAIGLNGLIFGLVDAVLLEPLPYPAAERLVFLSSVHEREGATGLSAPDLRDLREQAATLDGVAAFAYWGYTFTGGDRPRDLQSIRVMPGGIDLLGAEPALGRLFVPEEETPGRHRVALLSHGFWSRELGADPAVLGRTIELDAEPYTVVGVMPAGFAFPPDHASEIWAPLPDDPSSPRAVRQNRGLSTVGRLAPGAGLEAARDEARAIAGRLAERHPDTNTGWSFEVGDAHDALVAPARPALLSLWAAVALLLAIAAVNVSNLAVARLATRDREMAVRRSLGARRGQLVRGVAAEGLLVGLGGGAVGLAVHHLGIGWLRSLPEGLIPRLKEVRLDLEGIAFTLAMGLVLGLLLGLASGLAAARRGRAASLREGTGGPGRAARRALDALVVAEVALALVLLFGAGLTLRSFARLAAVDPGFAERERLLFANVFLPEARYGEPVRIEAFYRDLLERLNATPGVERAEAVLAVPLDYVGIDFDLPVEVPGRPAPEPGAAPQADYRVATPGYFDALGVPLLRGRAFEERDRAGAPRVMVVNETFAERFFPGEDPLGETVSIPIGGPHEVIGVIGDLRHRGLTAEPRPETFVPFAQQPSFGGMVVVVRTAGDPAAFAPVLQQTVSSIDPEQPIYQVQTVEELLADAVFVSRLSGLLFGVIAGGAFFLAVVGIYGVMAYAVARRTGELGLRMALGATGRDTLRLLLRRGLCLVGAGILLGSLAAVALTRVLAGFLFAVEPFEPAVLAGTAALFAAVAALANLLPARRALRVDPVTALAPER
jgi:predicted permease